MARRKLSTNPLTFIFLGVVAGFFLAHACSEKSTTTEPAVTEMPVERLVTEEDIILHKSCLETTKTKEEFKDCLNRL